MTKSGPEIQQHINRLKEKTNYTIIEFKAEKAFGEFNTYSLFLKVLANQKQRRKINKRIKGLEGRKESFFVSDNMIISKIIHTNYWNIQEHD